ncbi:hypothetical protein [Shewanella inventionis]|uniref:HNH endonuclease n=1 Tax=Shewanella inventionis TaxID=1738770 RepID=A0ABQ1IZS6_9GAMM|nr:hypothetical protein [Shewanella inventionis]MCL1157088.1 hypothetical protein [Shewanella inventionis]GGB55111.1 hypothetical protein GCM10011607_14600 [Shewanella inventionis]
MSKLIAYKSRGEYKGEPIYPHKHNDGRYVASPSRFEVDYVHVDTEEELEALVRSGLGARMSSPDIKQAASLITADNIKFTDSSSPPVTTKSVLPKLSEEVELDVDSISKSRKEQAFLRSHISRGRTIAKCVLCENEYPLEFLVAAHIKKRSECSKSEKLDFDNIAALMCKAGCDDMFEKGYVFVSGGVVKKNEKRSTTPALDMLIRKIEGNTVENWAGSSTYYKHHESKFNK